MSPDSPFSNVAFQLPRQVDKLRVERWFVGGPETGFGFHPKLGLVLMSCEFWISWNMCYKKWQGSFPLLFKLLASGAFHAAVPKPRGFGWHHGLHGT